MKLFQLAQELFAAIVLRIGSPLRLFVGSALAVWAWAQPSVTAAQVLLVVAAEPPQVTLVDATRLETVGRIALPRAPQGAPRSSPDGRTAWLGTRDGWIMRVDLATLRVTGEVRVGTALADFAPSSDGRWLLAGNEEPATLVLLDAELGVVKTFAATSADGKRASRVGTVADAVARKSFVVALRDLPEVWEISYDPQAEDIFTGLVHDYRMGEGSAVRGFHNVRRTRLAEPLADFLPGPEPAQVLGRAASAGATAQLVNLDVRLSIGTVALPGQPVLATGVSFMREGRRVLAAPNADSGAIDVIDMRSWQLVQTFATPALPLPRLAYLPGAHRLLACIGGTPGLVIAYDAQTLKEVKRLALSAAPSSCTLAPSAR